MTEVIGARIAAHRRRRGLSQAAVAGLVGRSESWLSQVERGILRLDSYSVLLDLARVLRVDIADLVAGPADSPVGRTEADEVVRAVERALLVVRRTEPHVALRAEVEAAHADYQAALYAEVLARTPALVAALDAEPAAGLVAAGYTVVAKTLTKVGSPGLALIAADRAWTAARGGRDPADVGMAVCQVAGALLPSPRSALAEDLAVEEATRVADVARPEVASVRGALWLLAAVAAARRGDRPAAVARLDAAAELARRIGRDANHRWTAFGPTNVAIHRVSVAVELGDAPAAIAAADAIDVDHLPAGLRSRRAQVHLDLAWAQARRRRDAEALVALLEVERTAPQAAHRNVVARDTIRQLLGRARGSTGTAVRGLADRAGVVL